MLIVYIISHKIADEKYKIYICNATDLLSVNLCINHIALTYKITTP